MNLAISVTFGNGGKDEQGSAVFSLKIQTPNYEVNIWMNRAELDLIRNVRAAEWDKRGSIKIGQSAGSSTFWSANEDSLSILVGHDDETWDFGVSLPIIVLDQILAEIEREFKLQ